MKQKCLAILSIVSLLTFALVVGMWIRSYRPVDCWTWASSDKEVFFMSSKGQIFSFSVEADYLAIIYSNGWHRLDENNFVLPAIFDAEPRRSVWRYGGFLYFSQSKDGAIKNGWAIPLYLIVFVSLIIPSLYYFSWRQRHRRAAAEKDARCFRCGYDLRATPERCPECGAVPQKVTI